MYNQDKKQFIFKLSNSETWNFFVDAKNNLCYCRLNKKRTWEKPSLIKKQVYPSFYADIDKKDTLHIIFQNLDGDIFYTFINAKTSKTIQILKGKNSTSYNKHLYLIPSSDSVHFFYILHYKNSIILSHQMFKNATISNPQILASSSKNVYPYSVFSDTLGNIYLYYNFFDGKFFQLGYKVYSPFEALWTKFSQLTSLNCNVYLSDVIMDDNNITHVIYQEVNTSNSCRLHYIKIPSKAESSIAITPYTNISFSDVNLVYTKNSLIVFWIKNNVVHYTKSSNNGISWSEIDKFTLNNENFCVKFKSNTPKDANSIISNSIPSTFKNGYTLASFNNVLLDYTAVSSISTNDFKTLVLDSLNLLKNKLETLNSEVTKLKSMYVNLNKKLSTLENKSNFIVSPTKNNLPSNTPTLLDAQTEYENFVSELKSNYNFDTNNNYNTSKFNSTTPSFNKKYSTFLPKRKKLCLNKVLHNKTFKKS